MSINLIVLILNIVISVLHPIKHIPQILHTVITKKANDLSKLNILCEFTLNIMSLTSCILIYVYMGKQKFFLPILIEKASSTIFIITIYILKIKYTHPNNIKSTIEERAPLSYKSFDV
tara:strand:+ start:220 stop:573 length:354 start_codon:yes stop_codon:yes gene_type:complete